MSEWTCVVCGGTADDKHPCRCCGTLGYHGGAEECPKPGSLIMIDATKMAINNPHAWQISEVNIPNYGVVVRIYVWVCRVCGSCGGKAPHPDQDLDVKEPMILPFLAGTPLIDLSQDCGRARQAIDEYVEKHPVWKEYVDKGRNIVNFEGVRL